MKPGMENQFLLNLKGRRIKAKSTDSPDNKREGTGTAFPTTVALEYRSLYFSQSRLGDYARDYHYSVQAVNPNAQK